MKVASRRRDRTLIEHGVFNGITCSPKLLVTFREMIHTADSTPATENRMDVALENTHHIFGVSQRHTVGYVNMETLIDQTIQ